MINILRNYILIAISLCCSSIAFSQWKQLDYSGGYTFKNIKINQHIFTKTYGGIYKSLDSGNTWLNTNNDTILNLFNVPSFSALGSNPDMFTYDNVLYCSYENILLKSIDEGSSWTKVALSPNLKFIKYYYLNGKLLAFTGSEDQKTYELANNKWVYKSHSSNYRKFFQSDSTSIYNFNLYSPQQGLYKSINGIDFFQVTLNGIPKNDSLWNGSYYHYWYHISDINKIGNFNFLIANDSLVFVSNNDGSWHRTNTGLPSKINFIHYLKVVRNSVFVRFSTPQSEDEIYQSDNYGQTWYKSNYNAFTDNVKFDRRIVCPSNNGVLISDDSGITWTISNSGLYSTYIYTMKASGNSLFAVDYDKGSLLLSKDHGNTWVIPKGLPNFGALNYSDLTLFKNRGFIAAGKYVYNTVDTGENWSILEFPQNMYYVENVSLFENKTSIFRVSDSNSNKHIYKTNNYIDYEIIDSTLPLPVELISGIVLHENLMYAWSYVNSEIYVSSDSGLTWSIDNNGLPTSSRLKYNTLEVVEGKLMLSVFDELYHLPPRLYIKESSTWVRKACKGIHSSMLSLEIIGRNNFLYTADFFTKSVFFSLDFGENWIKLDTIGLASSVSITYFALAVTDKGIFIGTHNNGMWYHGSINTNQDVRLAVDNSDLENRIKIFPNPANTSISIDASIKLNSPYKIYNTQGKLVQHGVFLNPINIEHLTEGTYIVQFLLENKTQAFGKLIIEK